MSSFTSKRLSDHVNAIFNDLIESVHQMKFKNQKQSDIRSFFRS